DIHAGPPPELEFFPVGLRSGVVLSLDVQTYCSVCHAASNLTMSGKDCLMPLKLKVVDCNCRTIKPVGATQLKSLKRNRYLTSPLSMPAKAVRHESRRTMSNEVSFINTPPSKCHRYLRGGYSDKYKYASAASSGVRYVNTGMWPRIGIAGEPSSTGAQWRLDYRNLLLLRARDPRKLPQVCEQRAHFRIGQGGIGGRHVRPARVQAVEQHALGLLGESSGILPSYVHSGLLHAFDVYPCRCRPHGVDDRVDFGRSTHAGCAMAALALQAI